MSAIAVIGLQYGDEGKGRLVDYLSQSVSAVIRYQGGDNAGHTVKVGDTVHKLHSIPSGILRPDVDNIIGAGCVVNPTALMKEIKTLRDSGVSCDNLYVSDKAHVVMPYHITLDRAYEQLQMIGTTCRGIGPCYVDKVARRGIRIGDLSDLKAVEAKVSFTLASYVNPLLTAWGYPKTYTVEEVMAEVRTWVLPERFTDTINPDLYDVLLEGQLGVMKDLDHGIYPMVTSSNTLPGYAAVGAGVAPTKVIGVAKAYVTSVGGGAFPTEMFDEDAVRLRTLGHEFGATTGRPRGCGWLDLVALRHAVQLTWCTSICLTKVDVLDTYDTIQVCVAYQNAEGKTLNYVPYDMSTVTPVYETFKGWKCDTTQCRKFSDLPIEVKVYIDYIECLTRVSVDYVSVGAERDALIVSLF